ncbi:hypothetical protein GOBAR_AA02559 [Gossypium barbadense]|uniref:Uncharacterized protein n=1 Tax=Gossypium barbadense TaxID=3634 RepID=A0A2P5YR11_GOSBA|nr:hypothetical protein GOBAR_AA02559 [Gossypium barbadense]
MAREPHQRANYDYMEERCFIFKPREFDIVWGNDNRCWRIAKPIGPSTSRKNEEEFAELLQVSWLEVTGITPKLDSPSTYHITFRLSLDKGASSWTGCKYKWKKLEVEKLTGDPTDFPSKADPLEVETVADQPDRRLYFGLYEVWSGKWKKGLKVYNATVKQINK